MRTATALLSLALLTVAAPASSGWLGPGFPPDGTYWLHNIAPQWFWWTWGWDTSNKTKKAQWPTPPKFHPQEVAVETKPTLTPEYKPRPSLPEGLRLMPPKEYDHPYSGPGKLQITYAKSQDEVRGLCPLAPFPKAGAFGCAHPVSPQGCWIIVAPVADMKTVGLTMDITLRHEIAHCNGWPSDHRGAYRSRTGRSSIFRRMRRTTRLCSHLPRSNPRRALAA
jgi:hypothetical protein